MTIIRLHSSGPHLKRQEKSPGGLEMTERWRERGSEVRNRGRKVDERCGFNDGSLFPKRCAGFCP